VVRSEEDGVCILSSKINPIGVYQVQQDTLIQWTKGGGDYALSFQEVTGCQNMMYRVH
jgi:hypothetical protein